MRYNLITSVLSLFLITIACAQDGGGVVDVTNKAALEAAKGASGTVEGKIAKAEWSRSGKVMNIEFEGAPDFVGAAFEKARVKLDEGFNGDLAKTLTGAKVRLTGKLDVYGGKAPEYVGRMQIIITAANQITILEPA
ncbi:MAG: hypothetical protein H7144_12330, partial [Burkholderiales bacterium]|nr:hypothetical protein [Phycisphaerae bacterium]